MKKLPLNKKPEKTISINARIDAGLFLSVKKKAKQEKVSVTEIIRAAFKQFLEE